MFRNRFKSLTTFFDIYYSGLGAPKPISRPHLTASVILPARAPLPPVPSAKKFPSGPASPHLVGFDPTDADLDYAPFSPAPFSPSGERPGSISIPRSSILASARKDSVGSFSSAGSSTIIETLPSSPITKNPDLLEVRTIFTPHLPDELVLCKGEKLTLIRSFDDGWCIVGRKSPFCVPIPVSPTGGFGKQSPVEDIEIGAVPKWVFESPLLTEKEKSRPSRTTSMAVNFVISDEPESY